MEDVGAQVASPLFIHHQQLSSIPRKRDLSYQAPNFQFHSLHHSPSLSLPHHRFLQNPRGEKEDDSNGWNPNSWDWDPRRFVAKPLDSDVLGLGNPKSTSNRDHPPPLSNSSNHFPITKPNSTNTSPVLVVPDEEDDRLRLNLAGGLNSVEEPVSRPNKRVRSGSPGNSTYPMCQVDNCKEDLSNAKDYHRRHKVCQLHSKSTKALVGKQMQRFCQQCSRFHPLSEFDEGKRSCRRRLAGHNRRRRKTQPEDVTSRLLLPGNRDTASSANLDIVNLLAVWARSQGKNEDKSINSSSVPNRDQLIQILNKINTLPLPMDVAAKLSSISNLSKNLEQSPTELQSRLRGTTSSSTMDLLTALSATLAASAPEAFSILSQRSSQSSDSEKSKLAGTNNAISCSDLQKKHNAELSSTVGERTSSCYPPPVDDSECQVHDTRNNLPLQLFSSSPENDSPPKLATSRKYFSSDSSNPFEERSPSSSPVVQKLFPLQSSAETSKSEKITISREINTDVHSGRTGDCILPLDLFKGSNRATEHSSFQNSPYQAGYTSSSGSDHSPSSQNSDSQERTGRIMFKLFDKDPSHFPGTLRQQIYNWLSNSPSEMESYIRPGCVVLSVYLSMSSAAWDQFERNLLQHVDTLVQHPDSDFWRSGRFLLHTDRRLASHKDGKLRLCKSWRTWSSPDLICVSPVAVVGGEETSLLLRGRNLTNPGTKIHCTYMGGYTTKEVMGLPCSRNSYDEISLGSFSINGSSSTVLGRCFIEVENGFKGNSFPVIIANAAICQELRLLETQFDDDAKLCDMVTEEQTKDLVQPRSREQVVHFLNELGWLFQRNNPSSVFEASGYSLHRFKFLLVFSVERDYCVLVKTILDMLVEKNLRADGLSEESLEILGEIQLLNRAVKRRCRKMVDLLIHYCVSNSDRSSKKHIFQPNSTGPGAITPLHLAACASNSEELVDALTNDPQEIGLSCWNSLLDATGQSPHAYAIMTNNHSYNKLVASKLADRRNGQIRVTIEKENEQDCRTVLQLPRGGRTCARCATVSAKYNRRILGTQGLLQRPYIHSMLAIAAVCVCVCLFLRGAPDIGLVAPFKWETLGYGTM